MTTKDKLNGIGVWLRLITPVLITILLAMMMMIREDVIDLRTELRACVKEINLHFNNHVSEHAKYQVIMENRLARIEMCLKEQLR